MQEKHAGYFQVQREGFLKIKADRKHGAYDSFVYMFLLSNAEYIKGGYIAHNGVRVKEGQVYVTHREIAQQLGLSDHKAAAKILKRLENYGLLRCETINVKGRGTSAGTLVTIINSPNADVENSTVSGNCDPNKHINDPNKRPNADVENSTVSGNCDPNKRPIVKKDKEIVCREGEVIKGTPLTWSMARKTGGVVGKYGNIVIDTAKVQRLEYAMEGHDIQAFIDRMSEAWAGKSGRQRGIDALIKAWQREENKEVYRLKKSTVEGNHDINANDEQTILRMLTKEGYNEDEVKDAIEDLKKVWTNPNQESFRARYGSLGNAVKAILGGR